MHIFDNLILDMRVAVSVKTTLDDPEEITVTVNDSDSARFEFPCSGHADDSTPVFVKWYRVKDDADQMVIAKPNKTMLCDNGSLILQMDGGWGQYGGQYKCRVSNGYSVASRLVTVAVLGYQPTSGWYIKRLTISTYTISLILARSIYFLLTQTSSAAETRKRQELLRRELRHVSSQIIELQSDVISDCR